MKSIKLVGLAVLGLVVVAVILFFFVFSNLNGIIKTVIEEVGSKVTQTEVSLKSVNLDLSTGKGEISGLLIGNPEGYSSDYAFQLDNIVLQIDLPSLTGPVVVIKEVTVDGAKLIVEQKGAESNLAKLLDNLDSSSKEEADTESKDPQQETSSTDVHLMMEKFAFINSSAKIIMEGSEEKALKIPDITRNNIGNKQTGLTPEKMAKEVLRSFIKGAVKAAGDYIKDLARQSMEKESGLEKAKESVKSLFKRGD